MADQRPSVGRIVHFVYVDHLAGLITGVHDEAVPGVVDAVDLYVFGQNGTYYKRDVPYDDKHRVGTWHWPERT